MQKIVYIAQELGLNLGYSFDWYLRGPYSPSLTHMLFTAKENGNLLPPPERSPLNVADEEIVERALQFLDNDVTDPKALELLASVWYFLPNRTPSNQEKRSLIEKTHEKKPRYTREEVEMALNRILSFRLA